MFNKGERIEWLERKTANLSNRHEALKEQLWEIPGDVRSLKSLAQLQDKKINNLIKVVEVLAKSADLKKVIAEADDGTEITLGDVLDCDDLMPQVEEDLPEEEYVAVGVDFAGLGKEPEFREPLRFDSEESTEKEYY